MKLIWTDLILLIPALLVLILCLVVGYHGGREDADRARAIQDYEKLIDFCISQKCPEMASCDEICECAQKEIRPP